MLGSRLLRIVPAIARANLITTKLPLLLNQRHFSISNYLLKKSFDKIDPESEVILLGNKDKKVKMKYSELMEKVPHQ